MRLGGHIFSAQTVAELDPLCEALDNYGLSAIAAPGKIADMTDEDAAAFGEKARTLDIVVGEAGFWRNLMIGDPDERTARVERVRTALRKADLMQCSCVVTLVGTRDPSDHPIAPHPYMFTDECRAEFREIVLRILDDLELKTVKYVIEPWHNTFFYKPEAIRAFIDDIGHPRFGLHLDQMNMVSREDFYDTTGLIERTFELLADDVAAVHLKDIRCDYEHMFLKWDETLIGDGVMDYRTYLQHLAQLNPDMPCFCEHLRKEEDYATNFSRLQALCAELGLSFKRRGA